MFSFSNQLIVLHKSGKTIVTVKIPLMLQKQKRVQCFQHCTLSLLHTCHTSTRDTVPPEQEQLHSLNFSCCTVIVTQSSYLSFLKKIEYTLITTQLAKASNDLNIMHWIFNQIKTHITVVFALSNNSSHKRVMRQSLCNKILTVPKGIQKSVRKVIWHNMLNINIKK